MHLTALIESCPYMPTTFRDFVKLAGRMGPAQPLEVKTVKRLSERRFMKSEVDNVINRTDVSIDIAVFLNLRPWW